MIYWALFALMLIGIAMYAIVKSRRDQRFSEMTKGQIIFYLLAAITFAILFWQCLLAGMQLSYTNINYSFSPFSALGVKTAGPLLSDVADQFLPGLWNIFVKKNYSIWDESIGLGATISLDHILYPLNYVYLLGLEYGQVLKYVLEYLIAFFGMFFFMKSLKLTRTASYLGGITLKKISRQPFSD